MGQRQAAAEACRQLSPGPRSRSSFLLKPAVAQRGAEHRGHHPCAVASRASAKALMRNRAGLSLTQELQLCQKSHGGRTQMGARVCTHPPV